MITIKKIPKHVLIMQMAVNIGLIAYGSYNFLKGTNNGITYFIILVGIAGIIIDSILYKKSNNVTDQEESNIN